MSADIPYHCRELLIWRAKTHSAVVRAFVRKCHLVIFPFITEKTHNTWRVLFHWVHKYFTSCDKDKSKCTDSVFKSISPMYQKVHYSKKKKKRVVPKCQFHTVFVCTEQSTTCLIILIYCGRVLWKYEYDFKATECICLRELFEETSSKFKILLFHNKISKLSRGENDCISLLNEREEQYIFRTLTMPIKPISVISNGSFSGASPWYIFSIFNKLNLSL